MVVQRRRLTVLDRTTIELRRRDGWSIRLIAADLIAECARLLRLGWSPEQISVRRKRIENGMEQPSGLQVSHEAIYTPLYALPRGELRRELLPYLRQAKPMRGRKPKGSERRGKLVGMINIPRSRDNPELRWIDDTEIVCHLRHHVTITAAFLALG